MMWEGRGGGVQGWVGRGGRDPECGKEGVVGSRGR